MDAISIPSPSAFPRSPVMKPTTTSNSAPIKASKLSSPPEKGSPADKTKNADSPTKPKQSKSRNGCITCKAKRLKCDEAKPTCQQCHRRNVQCGGYKKDFKWRAFEEATFTGVKATPTKPAKSPRPKTLTVFSQDSGPLLSPAMSEASISTAGNDFTPTETVFQAQMSWPPPLVAPPTSAPSQRQPPTSNGNFNMQYSPYQMTDPPPARQDQVPQVEYEPQQYPSTPSYNDTSIRSTDSPPSFSGQSPRLIDLLLPGTDLNARPPDYEDYRLKQSQSQAPAYMPSQLENLEAAEDEIEEIIRQPEWYDERYLRLPSPTLSNSSSSSDSRSDTMMLCRPPDFLPGSPEQLIRRFDKQTCGILSIKDGPTENPWRTLIWPLARESPALYHAIASMTAFHTAKEQSCLRVEGMDHMRQSIGSLAASIEEMPTDTALATTLVLAFAESWDQHISTGIQHLRGAKHLVHRAMAENKTNKASGDQLSRMRFLVYTWVYMDVLARLTSVEDDEFNDFDQILTGPFAPGNEVDPLMGCATTLFPLVGRVANLVRRVRKSSSNSPSIISQAMEIKGQIEDWAPIVDVQQLEDPTTTVEDSLQTAEAYRWATLLYLHQAVPEIPSLSSDQLAKKVLNYLATVSLKSRAVIVHIYPLLAAGCEIVDPETRQWVQDRWASMISRMWIGNVDRCMEVMKEVWNRRDAFEAQKSRRLDRLSQHSSPSEASATLPVSLKRKFSDEAGNASDATSEWVEAMGETYDPVGGGKRRAVGLDRAAVCAATHSRKESAENLPDGVEFERTVRGTVHWISVMKDWQWEVLLG